MRKHLAVNRARIEIINMFFEKEEYEYVNSLERENPNELRYVKTEINPEYNYLENDPQIGKNVKTIRQLEISFL